ncbi:MAG: precorrin-8X methylmutase [Verrucomicrobiales bacterium]|nr:precorrin-8X methylmutase [Verrucomicrobiales bacterium]
MKQESEQSAVIARLMEDGTGIVIAGHGSRDPGGAAQFETFMESFVRAAKPLPVTHGFLEFASPTIDVAVRQCVEEGAKRIAVVPAILLAATHAKNDMPTEVQIIQRDYPDVPIRFGAPIHLHPLVLQACRTKIIEGESQSKQTVSRKDTCLVIVGRGTTDPDANSDVYKLARILEEGLGFGASAVVYSGTAEPNLDDGLRRVGKMGFERLVVFPFFLFTGVLLDRIFAAVERQVVLSADSAQEVIKCDAIGLHPNLVTVLLERALEVFEGSPNMNCSLCKYRAQVVGYEHEVGTPQEGHHLHVRGLLAKQEGEEVPTEESMERIDAYEPHPIEAESFRLIEEEFEWSPWQDEPLQKKVLQRLVHTSGHFDSVESIYISHGALEAGLRALENRAIIVTDVTMVQSGLRRTVVKELGLLTFCGVHDEETYEMAEANGITRSAANIRRAWGKFGNDCIVVIGDAPTAIRETLRLIEEHRWRPHLVIGLPVGFVGTRESKQELKRCMRVPRVTNAGTSGGSPWAASVMNALLIERKNQLAQQCLQDKS